MKWNIQLLVVAALAASSVMACKVQPSQKSGRGQSCAASNDCSDELLCINQVCIQNDYPVEATAKVCDIIQCEADADCCEDFDRPSDCDAAEAACDPADAFTEFECQYVEQFCSCNEVCNDSQRCVQKEDPCVDDTECFGSQMCDTSTGECVSCLTADDCDEDEMCIEGQCDSGCKKNEDCPLFNACNGATGLCEETGCTDDRECILATGQADSVCKKEEGKSPICSVPCEENAECGSLNVCQDGECMFLGCESAEQCRTYLGLDDGYPYGEDARAVCREQTASNSGVSP